MSTATVESICEWTWVSEDGYRGKVPTMDKAERQEWVSLNEEITFRRLTRDEYLTLKALDRKIAYRARKEVQ